MKKFFVSYAIKDTTGMISIGNSWTSDFDMDTVDGILAFKEQIETEHRGTVTVLFFKELQG